MCASDGDVLHLWLSYIRSLCEGNLRSMVSSYRCVRFVKYKQALAPRPPPSLTARERLACLETFRRARAHHRSEMRRPLSEREVERAALAKAEMRVSKRESGARTTALTRLR